MPNWPIRRGQLIAPFGVGAMVMMRGGVSLVTAGLDHWFEREDPDLPSIDLEEFFVREDRLAKQLGVHHFYQPPDYRKPRKRETIPNSAITVPFLRFPRWHYCRFCGRLQQYPDTARRISNCPDCETRGRRNHLVQVPFVAICDQGHLQDFPWSEWVHRTATPTCQGPMRLRSTGGLTLANQRVTCDGCGAQERTLSGITTAAPDGSSTQLSTTLDTSGQKFLCRGHRPWLGSRATEPCTRPLRGSLRNASNVYFAQIKSSIYLPQDVDIPQELIDTLSIQRVSKLIEMLKRVGDLSSETLREQHPELFRPFTDEQVTKALRLVTEPSPASESEGKSVDANHISSSSEFLYDEYRVLRSSQNYRELHVREGSLSEYDPFISHSFSRVMLVKKMRETRAFVGFTRLYPDLGQSAQSLRTMLRKNSVPDTHQWLPAYVVHGEGIFLEWNFNSLSAWITEQKSALAHRLLPLERRYQNLLAVRGVQPKSWGPAFVMIHTFSHLIINRLTFESGYSTAALRERLYVSDDVKNPMAGLLVYTAAGDSDGTLGGLVRLGEPGRLESVVFQALRDAQWCSADPICMEMGSQGGQGPDSLNLAACYNCTIIAETACEHFNRFLDRGLVIGDGGNLRGFFSDMDISSK